MLEQKRISVIGGGQMCEAIFSGAVMDGAFVFCGGPGWFPQCVCVCKKDLQHEEREGYCAWKKSRAGRRRGS